jgi:hypothetical protein
MDDCHVDHITKLREKKFIVMIIRKNHIWFKWKHKINRDYDGEWLHFMQFSKMKKLPWNYARQSYVWLPFCNGLLYCVLYIYIYMQWKLNNHVILRLTRKKKKDFSFGDGKDHCKTMELNQSFPFLLIAQLFLKDLCLW